MNSRRFMEIRTALAAPAAILLAVVLCGGGCAASNQAGPRPAPDRAALSVIVRAVPKAGWRDATRQGSSYDPSAVGEGRQYETIDYGALEDIVVWVEQSEPDRQAQSIRIEIGESPAALLVSGTDDVWTIHNSTSDTLPIFARHESGRLVDLGTIAPGGHIIHQPRQSGLMEIFSDAHPDPLARVYVAPMTTSAGQRARMVRSGRRIRFNDLDPGPARVVCWHPRLPGSSASVNLVAGTTTRAELAVSVNQLPAVP